MFPSFPDAVAEGVSLPQANERLTLPSSPDQQETFSLSSTLPPPGGQTLSLTTSLPFPGQAVLSTDGFSLDSQQLTVRERNKCCGVNCQNPSALASRKCQYCCRCYCPTCAPLSTLCRKNPSGHTFVSSLRNRGPRPPRISRSREWTKKPNIEEGPPWQCKLCTMVNGPQVLVCLGCEALRDTEAQEGRNVCPMCTLVNEPGKTKCELCETDLVSKEQVHVTDNTE